ncbi:PGC-1 family member spargel isoform X2 [Arctopsyche grandis]|uniref:PGC-1 family member spargel isoform X2 n=1 Tax=Arctopsyche grandis TaxID=121162 RepID=UPI00406DA00F
METGMLGSFRTEEEQFMKSSFEDIHSFVDQSDVLNDRLHSSHSESNEEDYGRTLSDWQRHIMDSEDCMVNERLIKFELDILEYNSSPDKSKGSLLTADIDTKSNPKICKINYHTLSSGDNRLMDNDNTSRCNTMISSIIDNPMEETCNILDSFNEDKLLECDPLNVECDPLNDLFDTVKSDMGSNFECPESKITYVNTSQHVVDSQEIHSENHNNPILKAPQNSHIHKKYAMNSKSKRSKQKSLSLPQSPEHDTFGIDSIDLQSCLCFEDISGLDFNEIVDDDINIRPEKAFNKSFDIADVFATKDDILKKEMDTPDDLFDSQMQDCDLEVDINDFDLPSFIMGQGENDPSALLIDCFEETENALHCPKTEIDDINVESIANCDDALPNISKFANCSDLVTKCSLLNTEKESFQETEVIPVMILPSNDASKEIDTNPQSPIDSTSSNGRKTDTEDYIDVESVSDNESFPVLAANNVNALLEQFEATEDISKSLRSVRKLTIPKDSQYTQNNTKVSKEPYLVFPTIWKTDFEDSTGTKDNNKMRFINPRLQKNVKTVSSSTKLDQEQVYLDHDYCFVSPLRSEPRILGKHGVSTSKSEQNLKSSEESDFIDLSSYYVRPSNNQNLIITKGKNKSLSVNSNEKTISKSEPNSLLKPLSPSKAFVIKGKKSANNISISCVKQKVTDAFDGISGVDHSYSRAGIVKQNISNKSNTGAGSLVFGHSKLIINKSNDSSNVKLPDKNERKETKSIQNIIVLENGSERLIDINKEGQNILSVNRNYNSNKNSLLITNFKKQSEDKIVQKDLSKRVNCKGNQRQKFSLLKPIVKENVKMISLLKSNYCDETDLKKKEIKSQEDTILKSLKTPETPNAPPIKTKELEKIVENPSTIIIQGNKISQKRKLNIEEYKKRREGGNNSRDNSRTCSPTGIGVVDLESCSNSLVNNSSIQIDKTPNMVKEIAPKITNPANSAPKVMERFEMKTKTVTSKILFDPIADATRKALKLKKQSSSIPHEDKIIKSKISNIENVIILPLATENGKLLPMIKKIDEKEVVTLSNEPAPQKKIEEFDEITTVCIGINTDIDYLQSVKFSQKYVRSCINFEKNDQKPQNDIVTVELKSIKMDCSSPFNWENKTIMHLKKNRSKPITCSVYVQTDSIEIPDETVEIDVPKLPEKNALPCEQSSTNATSTLPNKKSHRERRDSSMSISGESNCDNHTELINRWRIDAMKKRESRSRSQSSNSSSCSLSPRNSKSKRRNHNAKYKYRSRYSSQSSDSSRHSSKYKRRSRSFSRNRPKYRKTRGESYKSKYYMKEKDSPDNRSIQSLPSNSKRKRNPSMTSNDWKEKSSSYENQSSQPPSKISRDYGKNWDTRNEKSEINVYGYKKAARSRSSSVSSDSSLSSGSSIDSDSSTNNHSSSGSSVRSNSLSPKYDRSRSRSRRGSRYSRSGGSRSNKRPNELFEERKVVYVGMLEPNISVSGLKMKFIKYGCVEEVTIHMKDDGMRYGFVTFAQAQHSYKALENAPKDPDIKHYDVFFGGRRAFCKQFYADLDDLEAMEEESGFYPTVVTRSIAPAPDKSFEHLLQEAKAAVSARKARDQSNPTESRNKKCGKV